MKHLKAQDNTSNLQRHIQSLPNTRSRVSLYELQRKTPLTSMQAMDPRDPLVAEGSSDPLLKLMLRTSSSIPYRIKILQSYESNSPSCWNSMGHVWVRRQVQALLVAPVTIKNCKQSPVYDCSYVKKDIVS